MLRVTNTPPVEAAPAGEATADDTHGLVPGSPLAQTLFRVLSGTRVTVVKSPPGAGKTTLIVDVVERISEIHPDLKIVVATPTNQGGGALLRYVDTRLGPGRVTAGQKIIDLSGVKIKTPSPGAAAPRVEVRTVASLKTTKKSSDTVIDLLIFDEAYQTTLADVVQCANARQVLMVGDPGQIGPVVTADTTPWEHLGSNGPHSPAPHYFSARTDAVTLPMKDTYRLGADTVAVIGCLYPFPFASARPDVTVSAPGGVVLTEIQRITVPEPAVPHDMNVMRTVAERAVELAQGTVTTDEGTRPLTGNDVAVVVSHNAQATAVRSHIASIARRVGLAGEVTVGTADSLQGGQWVAVVSVDPLLGHPVSSPHSRSNGRLCVMLSRHIGHLTWVHDGGWREALAGDTGNDAKVAVKVRTALGRKEAV